jgi:GNAT superfamily N-acetyltransferase
VSERVRGIGVEEVPLDRIQSLRERYRSEMNCQIIHDSIHSRPGWTREYQVGGARGPIGYGSVAVAGPWSASPALYEFYILPDYRLHVFEAFRALAAVAHPPRMEVQSNDRLSTVMLHAFATQVASESILFEDGQRTHLAVPGAVFRQATPDEAPDVSASDRQWRGVVEFDGRVAATGGVLFHYNPPYGDVYMEVAEPFRRRGVGAFLVQELKRLCYARGFVPAARCNPSNVASQGTLQKAGFVPCGHILTGSLEEIAP